MKLPASDLYIVYSMSNSAYQQWQADLLDFSVQASGQPGVIVRLCSREVGDTSRPIARSASGYTMETPDFTRIGRSALTRWLPALKKRLGLEAHGRFHFYCLNKALAMKVFLDKHPEIDDHARLLWLDPDMVFNHPWVPDQRQVHRGRVLGQLWWGFEREWCNEYGGNEAEAHCPPADQAIMFPFCMTVHDMRKTAGAYGRLSAAIYRRTRDWKSEMYALVLAMGAAGLECRTIPALGTCNDWPPEMANDAEAPISHYTQAMSDRSGHLIFDKRDYTPFTRSRPWKRPPPAEAPAALTDRRTLAMIHRFIDWQTENPGGAPGERLPP